MRKLDNRRYQVDNGEKMKAVLLERGELKIKEVLPPVPSGEEALIRVIKAGICNTDLEIIRGYMEFEGILGHEFVGEVVESSRKDLRGKRVVGEINIFCNQCEFCLKGLPRHCSSRKVLGIYRKDGVFAEFVTLPLINLHLLPQEVSDHQAVFVEPLASALEILEQIEVRKKESILVIGDGKLGLLIAQVMKLESDEVYCLGKHERKLELIRKRNVKVFLKEEDIAQKFDLVVEATGKKEGLRVALSYVKPRGKIVLKSTFKGNLCLDVSKIVVDEIELIGSRCGPFPRAIEVLKSGRVDVEGMVDGEFPLDEALQAFRLAQKPGVMKILLSI